MLPWCSWQCVWANVGAKGWQSYDADRFFCLFPPRRDGQRQDDAADAVPARGGLQPAGRGGLHAAAPRRRHVRRQARLRRDARQTGSVYYTTLCYIDTKLRYTMLQYFSFHYITLYHTMPFMSVAKRVSCTTQWYSDTKLQYIILHYTTPHYAMSDAKYDIVSLHCYIVTLNCDIHNTKS